MKNTAMASPNSSLKKNGAVYFKVRPSAYMISLKSREISISQQATLTLTLSFGQGHMSPTTSVVSANRILKYWVEYWVGAADSIISRTACIFIKGGIAGKGQNHGAVAKKNVYVKFLSDIDVGM
jgi:hypothetical protein